MKKSMIIKVWKSELFREGLSGDQLAMVPANPAGIIELSAEELELVAGGLVATTGSSPSVCSCYVTSTGTGPGCSCTCPDPAKPTEEAV